MVQKNSPHLYPKIQGFEGVFWRMIYNLFTKFKPANFFGNLFVKKFSSPIWKNIGFCGGLEEGFIAKYLSITYIQKYGVLSPPTKNTSHLYARKSGFRDHVSNRMYTMFTNQPLTYKDKKWPFYRVIGILFTFCLQPWYAIPHLIATQKAKVWALSKNIPHLYEFLRGGLAPLFTAYFEKYFLSSSNRTKNNLILPLKRKWTAPNCADRTKNTPMVENIKN